MRKVIASFVNLIKKILYFADEKQVLKDLNGEFHSRQLSAIIGK